MSSPAPRPHDVTGYWEQRYQESPVTGMPWYYEDLDPDLKEALTQYGLSGGRFLDLGAGPGTQAAALQHLGFEVTGSDLSETAMAGAAKQFPAVTFVQDDILASRLTGPYQAIFDRGCFHVLPPEKRSHYIHTVHQLLSPGGWFFLKCFSTQEPTDYGPYKFTPEALSALFQPGFTVHALTQTRYQGTLDPWPMALFAVMQKI